MAFKIPLTDEQRGRIAEESAIAAQCHVAADVELGRRLLRLAQDVRKAFPRNLPPEPAESARYGSMLVWEVVPEIARRLGATDFERGRRPYSLKQADASDLRILTANSIFGSRQYLVLQEGDNNADPLAWSLLKREPCNGNPLVIALDRVAPPTDHPNDILAKRLLEVSQRRGHAPARSWSPALNEAPQSAPEAERTPSP